MNPYETPSPESFEDDEPKHYCTLCWLEDWWWLWFPPFFSICLVLMFLGLPFCIFLQCCEMYGRRHHNKHLIGDIIFLVALLVIGLPAWYFIIFLKIWS
jgi:hypothetical protein